MNYETIQADILSELLGFRVRSVRLNTAIREYEKGNDI